MADSSFTQSNFLGGQWSPNAQGRIDHPAYKTALALSTNGLPLEEGAWSRRSGTRDHGVTNGNGQIKEFWLPGNVAVVIELTPNMLAFWMMDAVLGYRRLATTFSTIWSTVTICQSVRLVQIDQVIYVFWGGNPYLITCTNYTSAGVGNDPSWSFSTVDFSTIDGPYNDALAGASQTDNSLGAINGPGPSLAFTITDGAYSFVASDVNRAIRLWSQPAAWNSTASYNVGDPVTYQDTYWTALVGGSLQIGVPPGSVTQPPSGSTTVPTQAWTLAPQQATWAYGYITGLVNDSQVNVTLVSTGAWPQTGNGLVIDTWQLGLYTANIWPTCGCYQGGRLWAGGALPNRLDSTVSNATGTQPGNPLLFSPTDQYGNVLDDSGIEAPLNLSPAAFPYWLAPDHSGIIVGSASGEQLVTASNLNDPITPTSIDIRPQTVYKSQNSEPVRCGIAIAFIQSFGRRVMEYVVDVFSQRFIGAHLNEFAKDLTEPGIAKVVYQEELAPVIWAVLDNGQLLGCTYRRVSHFGSEKPLFNAWHLHALGSGRPIQWACNATSVNGPDLLALLTQDQGGHYRLETMQPLFDTGQTLPTAKFLDSYYSSTQLSATDASGSIVISGLPTGLGNVDYGVFIAGLYAGTWQASLSGTITVPYGSDPDGLLTQEYVQSYNGSWGDIGVAMTIGGRGISVPLIVGSLFSSICKQLRPLAIDETRTVTGPALAKTRRNHMYGALFSNTVTGVTVQVDSGPAYTANFVAQDQQTQINHTLLYSGVFWDILDDDYSFDGQIQVSQELPYPMTIAALGGFLHTQDR